MSKRILIVDDNEELRKALVEIVKSGGHEAIEAEDGRMALELVEKNKPDLIISDLQMPHMDGLELLRHVKTKTPIPFILMTAFTQIIETQRAFEMGADDFFTKPFKNEDILSSVTKLLAAKPGHVANENIDELFCRIPIQDFVSHEAVRVNVHVRLSATKYVRVAHKGDMVPLERVENYKTKGVIFLYAQKADFAQLVGFNLRLSKAINAQPEIAFEKKANFLRYTAETVLENIAVNGIDRPAYDDAKECMRTYLQLACDSVNICDMLNALNGHANWLYAHSMGVGIYSIMIAKKLGWNSSQTFFKLGMAGLFHDIGHKEVDNTILQKPRPLLTQKERQIYETHSVRGREILETLREVPGEIAQIVCEHHENCHGQGYPMRIPKARIHPLAKVIAVADAFCYESLKSPYSDGESASVAIQKVMHHDGLDVNAVQALRSLCSLCSA